MDVAGSFSLVLLMELVNSWRYFWSKFTPLLIKHPWLLSAYPYPRLWYPSIQRTLQGQCFVYTTLLQPGASHAKNTRSLHRPENQGNRI